MAYARGTPLQLLDPDMSGPTTQRCVALRSNLAVCAPVPDMLGNAFIGMLSPSEVGNPCHTVLEPFPDRKIQVCAPTKLEAHLNAVALAETYFDKYTPTMPAIAHSDVAGAMHNMARVYQERTSVARVEEIEREIGVEEIERESM